MNATEVRLPLHAVTEAHLLACGPVRSARWHPKQRHLPGWYWSATERAHVMYESRLELARLQFADFAPEVVAIRAQPFRLLSRGPDGRQRTHVPDFALLEADGTIRIVNVKLAERVDDPKVRDTFAWAHSALEARGFPTEVWTGADPVVAANLRFIAGYRNADLFAPHEIDLAASIVATEKTIEGLEAALSQRGVEHPRPLVMHLLWTGRIACDLAHPIDRVTEVTAA